MGNLYDPFGWLTPSGPAEPSAAAGLDPFGWLSPSKIEPPKIGNLPATLSSIDDEEERKKEEYRRLKRERDARMLAMGAMPTDAIDTQADGRLTLASEKKLYGDNRGHANAYDGSWMGDKHRDLTAGLLQVPASIVGEMETAQGLSSNIYRAVGLDTFADMAAKARDLSASGRRTLSEAAEEISRSDASAPMLASLKAGNLGAAFDTATSDALRSLPGMGVSALMPSAKGRLLFSALQEGGTAYGEARDEGTGELAALAGAAAIQGVGGFLESKSLGKLLGEGEAGEIAVKGMFDAWRRTAARGLSGAATEAGAELAQGQLEYGVGAAQGRHGWDPAQAAEVAARSVAAGGLMGGPISGASFAADHLTTLAGMRDELDDIADWSKGGLVPKGVDDPRFNEFIPLLAAEQQRRQKRGVEDYLGAWQPVKAQVDAELATVAQRAEVRAAAVQQLLDTAEAARLVQGLGTGGAAQVVGPEAGWSVNNSNEGEGFGQVGSALGGALASSLNGKVRSQIRAMVPFLSADMADAIASGTMTAPQIQEAIAAEESRQVRAKYHRLFKELALKSGSMVSADMADSTADAVTPTTPAPRPPLDPNEDVRALVRDYSRRRGMDGTAGEGQYLSILEDRSKEIADLYEQMQHDPHNPQVRESYDAFKQETREQWEFLVSRGVVFEVWEGEGQPYADSASMTADIRDNNHLYFFPTDLGFGSGDSTPADHPLLESAGIRLGNRELVYNDVFRAVHDFFGHAAEGYQFGPRGEENAWGKHSRMYSPVARRAMTAETRGQNSWVNFGGHLRRADGTIPKKGDPDFVPADQRPFAAQKAGLLPERFSLTDEELADQIADRALTAHLASGGVTFNAVRGNLANSNEWVVSTHPDRGEVIEGDPTPEQMRSFARKNWDLLGTGKINLGGWKDGGKTYLDLSELVPEGKEAAVELGRKKGQKAVGKLIPGGFQEELVVEVSETPDRSYRGTQLFSEKPEQARQYVARNSDGEEVAYLLVHAEPEGGFRVKNVQVEEGSRGKGVAERLYLRAFEDLGTYLGPTDNQGRRTDAGNRMHRRLLKTVPEVFADPFVAAAQKGDGMVTVEHYSFKQGLDTIDPAAHGTGKPGQERRRRLNYPGVYAPRSYAYSKGATPEHGLGPHKYTLQIPASEIYDMETDPAGIIEALENERDHNGRQLPWATFLTLAERRVADAGFTALSYRRPRASQREYLIFKPVPTVHTRLAGSDVLYQGALGIAPSLEETYGPGRAHDPNAKALLAPGHSPMNVGAKLSIIDKLLAKHPRSLASVKSFGALWSDIVRGPRVPVAPRVAIGYANDPKRVAALVSKLTPGQRAMADEGLELSRQLGDAYTSGLAEPLHTGKLMMWAMLSRGVSPFVQEGAYIDAEAAGVSDHIQAAVDGKFDIVAYREWAETAIPEGSSGRGTTQNLNAFGKTFLEKMSQRGEDGMTHLAWLHKAIGDRSIPSAAIRREFHRRVKGVGIDNKVLSFSMLLAGRQDVLVMDRVQTRHLWNDGRFSGDSENIYDGAVFARDGGGLSGLLDGIRGLVVYESFERELAQSVRDGYAIAGRAGEGTMGRFHWESWVVLSGMEASHGSLSGLLNEMQGDGSPYANVGAREGRYNTYKFGAVYSRNAAGEPAYWMPANGVWYELSPTQLDDIISTVKKPAGGVVPRGFKISESKEKPWYEQEGVDLEALGQLVAKHGRPVAAAPGGHAAPQAAAAGTDAAGSAEEVTLPPVSETLTPEAKAAWGSVVSKIGASAEQEQAALVVLKSFAERKLKVGISEYILKRIAGGGSGEGLDVDAMSGMRGAVQFLEDGRAIIHAIKDPDPSTLLHELVHIMVRDVQGADLKVLARFAGVKVKDLGVRGGAAIPRAGQEKIAKAWERFLAEGVAPTPDLQPTFSRLKAWFADIYQGLALRFSLSPSVRQTFGNLLSGEGDSYGMLDTATGGEDLFQPPRPSAPPALPGPEPMQQYIEDGLKKKRLTGAEVLEKAFNAFQRHMINDQDVIRRKSKEVGGAAGKFLYEAFKMKREKVEVARSPIERGTHLRNPVTGQPEYTGASLKEIIGGLDAETMGDLSLLMLSESQIETDTRRAQQVTSFKSAQNAWQKQRDELHKAMKEGDLQLVQFLQKTMPERPSRASFLKAAKLDLKKTLSPEEQARLDASDTATDDAEAQLERLQAKWGDRFGELLGYAEGVRQWSIRANLDVLVAAGRISADKKTEIVNAQQKYAPFLRLLNDDLKDDLAPYARLNRDTLAKRTGDVSEGVINPLVGFIMKAQQVQKWAADQYAINALADIADAHPNVFPEVEFVNQGPPRGLDPSKEVKAWKDGEPRVMRLDAELMRAVADMNPAMQHWFMKTLAAFAKVKRAGATLVPGFLSRNPAKDQFAAGINSDFGYVPVYHLGMGLVAMLANSHPALSKIAPQLAELAKEAYIAGGMTSGLMAVDMKGANISLDSLVRAKTPASRALKSVRSRFREDGLLFPLQMVGNALEQGTRVGAYVNARRGPDILDRGLATIGLNSRPMRKATVREAAVEMREVSIDFNQMGQSGRFWNAAEEFVNPTLQDMEKVRSNFQRHPARTFAKAFAYITVPALLNLFLRRDDEDYDDLHEVDKLMFYHPMKFEDGGYLRFPRPIGIMNVIFGWVPHKMIEYARGIDDEAAKHALAGLVDQSILSYADGVRGMMNLAPAAAQPVVDVAFNKDWRGMPIENEYQRRQKLDKTAIGMETEGPTANAIAQGAGMAAEAAGFSPIVSAPQVEALITGYGAGLGRLGLEGADAAAGATFGVATQPLSYANDPNYIARFLGWKSVRPIGFGSKPVSEFYLLADAALGAANTIKEHEDGGRDEKAMRHRMLHPEYDYSSQLEKVRREISDYRKERRLVQDDKTISEEQRLIELLEIDQMVTQRALSITIEVQQDIKQRGKSGG